MLEFFIRRPVLSGVISMLIVLLGVLTIPTLPVSQYPNLAPPTVSVTANYLGASAETVERAVTIPLEQELNGTEGMRYIQSSSSNDGVSTITLTFAPDRDIDVAAVDVQNRVSRAAPRLPSEVNQTGITIEKVQPQFLLAYGLYGAEGRYDELFLSNYADVYLKDAIKRVPGVGNVVIFGERKFAMRIWLDPLRLAQRKLTADDVVRALREQNLQVAAGAVGQEPIPKGQKFQISVQALSRLQEPEEFSAIVLSRGPGGSLVRLGDVARVELGAESYTSRLRLNGATAVGLGVFQLPTANALETREAVVAEMDRLRTEFPPGLELHVAFDTTRAVEESIRDVLLTLAAAVCLVILVVLLFLHRLRAVAIVALTLPVSLIGTFAFVGAFGFSMNVLTLFGLTLATGLVVDDAIVVIENIERLMREEQLSALEATRKGLRQVAGPVVATSLVLVAVFVPVSFFPGTTGAIYRQFALTITASILISLVCALTLTPALCALLLRPGAKKAAFFRAMDRALDHFREGYGRALQTLIRRRAVVLATFLLAVIATVLLYRWVPGGFIPDEDQGWFIVALQAPEGVALEHTDEVLREVEGLLKRTPGTADVFSVSGFSVLGTGPNYGIAFVTLEPWDERGEDESVEAIIDRLRGELTEISGARVLPLQPPPISGVGTFGGFQFVLQNRAGTASLDELAGVTWKLAGAANQDQRLTSVFSTYSASTPLLVVEVDRERARAQGVSIDSLYSTLQILLGSQYVNDFDFANRTFRVYVQADQQFRETPQQLQGFYVRNEDGQMIPLEALVKVTPRSSAQAITHYNLYRSAELNGSAGPGQSTGTALTAMDQIASGVLPQGYSYEWTGASLEQVESAGRTLLLFALAVVFVFLLLAALYESFLLPLAIILSVPVAILGALAFQGIRGLPNDVFCQVGLVLLVALASKNAILIVEFAERLRLEGKDPAEAVIAAAKLRLRPILMTSIAFILGVVPLVVASGAGAAARRSLGTVVFGGVLVSTFVNLVYIPVVYVQLVAVREWLLRRVSRVGRRPRPPEPTPA